MSDVLLEVRDLVVHFPTPDGVVKAVDGVSFTIERGRTLGVVGESGSGKSITFLTVMGLINRKSAHVSGEVLFEGRNLLEATTEELRHIRGDRIGMIFQDPMTSLDPCFRIGLRQRNMADHAANDIRPLLDRITLGILKRIALADDPFRIQTDGDLGNRSECRGCGG